MKLSRDLCYSQESLADQSLEIRTSASPYAMPHLAGSLRQTPSMILFTFHSTGNCSAKAFACLRLKLES